MCIKLPIFNLRMYKMSTIDASTWLKGLIWILEVRTRINLLGSKTDYRETSAKEYVRRNTPLNIARTRK